MYCVCMCVCVRVYSDPNRKKEDVIRINTRRAKREFLTRLSFNNKE